MFFTRTVFNMSLITIFLLVCVVFDGAHLNSFTTLHGVSYSGTTEADYLLRPRRLLQGRKVPDTRGLVPTLDKTQLSRKGSSGVQLSWENG